MSIVVHEVKGSKGATYYVRLYAGIVTCTCPHYQYRGLRCKHIEKAVAEFPDLTPEERVPALTEAFVALAENRLELDDGDGQVYVMPDDDWSEQ